jgi:hypothetical protein
MNLWQVRIMVKEPWEIKDTQLFNGTFDLVLDRAMTDVARTSYMVNGPNREVYWSIEQWETGKHKWRPVMQGRSRVKDRPSSKRYPGSLG